MLIPISCRGPVDDLFGDPHPDGKRIGFAYRESDLTIHFSITLDEAKRLQSELAGAISMVCETSAKPRIGE
jgi:hypothetical protein